MLKSVLTRKTCTLISTWKIGCKAFTIHFKALCLFTNTFSFKNLFFRWIRGLFSLMKLLLISLIHLLTILLVLVSIFILLLVLELMLIHKMSLIIMLVVKVLFMGIKVIIMMTEIHWMTQVIIFFSHKPANLTKINQLILWLSSE